MEVDFFRKLTMALGKIQVKHPYLVLGAALVFTILIIPGFGLVYFDTSNENFLPENDPVVESLFVVGTDFSGFSGLSLLFFSGESAEGGILDLRDPRFLKKIDVLAKYYSAIEYIGSVRTPVETIKQQNNGVIPNDIETVKKIVSQNPRLKEFYNSDFSIMRINVLAESLGEESSESKAKLSELMGQFESLDFPEGITAKFWGETTQFIELDENLGSDLGFTTLIAFAVIFLLIVLFYRSIVSGILSIFPIIISLVWTVGTMGYINLPFTMLTSGFIPLVMGLGIDYSIHLIHGVKHLQGTGKKIEDAIEETLGDVGESISAATITTSIGFLSLVLASLLVTQRLGITLTLSVVYIFVGCIVIVPPVLLLQERLFKNTGR